MMKCLKFLLLIPLITLLFLFSPKSALAEEIQKYQVDVQIYKNAQINIVEQIDYDFGSEQRHGIFREIPFVTTNAKGEKYKMDISIKTVTDSKNNPIKFVKSTEGENIILKIGDPNKTISGLNTYVISYSVEGAITYFSDHDELYWNAIGTDWKVPIRYAQANIRFGDMPAVNLESSNAICYTGYVGSKSQDCKISAFLDNQITIRTNKVLTPKQGLTFAISVPKGILEVHEPEKYNPGLGELIAFLLWLITNVGLSLAVGAWWFFKGRDPKDNRVIVRMYDAPKDTNNKEMSPLELGTVMDERISSKDLSSEIVNLAIHKYLIIKEDDKKKVSIQRGPKLQEDLSMASLKPHQQDLIKAFDLDTKEETSLSDKTKSYSRAKKITELKNELYKSLTDQAYFKGNPEKTRSTFFLIGFVCLFISLFIPAIIILILGYFMPRKTQLGVEIKRHGLGLKQFLDSQDRQFEFQEKNFYLFEKLLPYAISFGVAKIWAKKFEDLYDYKPEWYQTNQTLNTYTTFSILDSLDRNLSKVESNYATPTSSSTGHSSGFSGGSSGGGGGGGGGGSW